MRGRDGRARTRIYLGPADRQRRAQRLALPGIFWSAVAGGMLLKGPLILMFIALTIVTLAILDRPADWLWRLRPLHGIAVDAAAGAAVVHRHRGAQRLELFLTS